MIGSWLAGTARWRQNPALSLSALFVLAGVVLVASLLLGGGTRAGFLSDAILQFLAIGLLAAAAWKICDAPLSRQARLAAIFCFLIALIPLLQLIPLPPAVWTALPNRQPIIDAFVLIDKPLPWMPVSVSPQATWLSFLSLLVPISIFLATIVLSYRERRRLSLLVLGVGLLSVLVGLLQVAQGPDSPLRFFEVTNRTEAVGFFANRNHFAALLYALMLLTLAWAAAVVPNVQEPWKARNLRSGPTIALVVCFTVFVVLIAAQAMARSRAGLGLSMLVLLGVFVFAFWHKRPQGGITPAGLMLGAFALVMAFGTQFALYRIWERVAFDSLEGLRIPFARKATEAAQAFMPFGSGMGTFVPVYALFEKTDETLPNMYANHAHNDFLELWMEAGIFGLLLLGLFIVWVVWRAWQAWRVPSPAPRPIDAYLVRTAPVIIAFLLLHSIVDYPLRTAAMMAILAFVSALLIEPPVLASNLEPARERPAEGLGLSARQRPAVPSAREPAQTAAAVPSPPIANPVVRERKLVAMDWPKQWRESPKQGSLANEDPDGTRKPGDT